MNSTDFPRRPAFRIVWAGALLIQFVFFSWPTPFSIAADDQTTKAVRRSPSDQKKVALVIGNNDYKDAPLKNPAHDAQDIANVLRSLGFTVQTKINADQREIESAVKEFVRDIQNGDVGLFYFSGHGVQVHGENYLMPVGGYITSEADVKYKAVSAGYILAQMDESRNRTNIFILDACRNNPFRGFRSMSKGLNMMDAPAGTFLAYATAPGSVAADGTDRNSPYAKNLIRAIKTKDMAIEQVFKHVLREVRKETQGQQVPWTASSLQDDFYFNPSSPTTTQQASLQPSTLESALVASSKYREKAERLGDLLSARGDPATRKEIEQMYRDPEAVKWFRQAAEAGDALAQLWVGRMFAHGLQVAKDEREAVKWYRRAADQGNSSAQNNLAAMYRNGLGVVKDQEEAVKWFRKGADQGNAMSQVNLGSMYETGAGIAKDQNEAVRWYKKAADQENSQAQFNLGRVYKDGLGLPRDLGEALKWFRKAADQGHTSAENYLGIMCHNGLGVTKDAGEACKWYRKAAEKGDPWAQTNLGMMYRNGSGVAKDYDEAVKWYKKAVEQGNVAGQTNLGVMYENGWGVAKDLDEALKSYRKAAEQKYPLAQNNLGLCYEHGRGVPKDYDEAVKWYRKAADQGNAYGQSNLGRMYANGWGVPKDRTEAIKWFTKASDQGNEYAKKELSKLSSTSTETGSQSQPADEKERLEKIRLEVLAKQQEKERNEAAKTRGSVRANLQSIAEFWEQEKKKMKQRYGCWAGNIEKGNSGWASNQSLADASTSAFKKCQENGGPCEELYSVCVHNDTTKTIMVHLYHSKEPNYRDKNNSLWNWVYKPGDDMNLAVGGKRLSVPKTFYLSAESQDGDGTWGPMQIGAYSCQLRNNVDGQNLRVHLVYTKESGKTGAKTK
jgi:TPR repeat protein